ncbi:amino acid polyamine transporter I protein [Physcia stellaris]|nr:amino acid polyamine transporter I protein [Physcia stellaris]
MGLPTADDNGMEKSPFPTEVEVLSEAERDVQALARLGKKPILKRRFSFLSMLGFTCTILVTWEAELVYIFTFIGSIAIYTTMGELASMAPTSGGQYHWISMLAPSFCKKFVSYITGWLVICGWQAILAGSGYLGGNMLVALAQLNYPDYAPQLWQATLAYWAVMALAILINVTASKILPKLESFILVLHLVGFLAVLIPLVHLAPEKASARDVFTKFNNGGGWSTTALSVFVGLLGNVFATYVNIDSVLESPTGLLGYPFMQVFLDATGSVSGASTMICIVIIMMLCATIAFLATSSRIVFAFGRDRGLPFSQTMAKVGSKSAIPMYAIIVMAGVSCLIGLINIGSATAFNAVISLGVSSLYASYVLTEAFLLWHRLFFIMASTDQESFLEALPAELKLQILSLMCDTASLRHLVFASTSYYSVYCAYRDKVSTTVTTNELAARKVHILPPENEKCLICLLGVDTDYNEVVKLVNELYSVVISIYDYYSLPSKNPPILSVQQCKALLQIKCILPYELWRDELDGEWTVGVKYPEDRVRVFGGEEGVYFNVYRTPPLVGRE